MDERWQSFKMFCDTLEMDYDSDEPDESDKSDDDTFISLPENPQIERLRRDKFRGVAPPYCATAPALFPRNTHPDDIKLGEKLRLHKPTPLRNIALSNVPKRPPTGALKHSLPCPLAPPPPPPASIIYSKRCKNGIDRATIPKRPSGLVRHDRFDKQQAIHNKYRNSEGSPESTKGHWARMSKGNGPIQVVRYRRKRSTFNPLPHTCPRRHGLKSSTAEVTGQYSIQPQYRNCFWNPRQRKRGRVLFQKSVEYEAKDISELIDDDIREARRVEAELRINTRRKELQLYSEKGGLFQLEALRIPTRARRVPAPARSKAREVLGGAKGAGACQKASCAVEPSLNDLSACKSSTETRRSMSKNLLEDYVGALKMWPSRPEGRVKSQGNDKPPVSGDKGRPIETANCSQFSKSLRTESGSLECVSRDDTAWATKALPTHVFEEPRKQILTVAFEGELEEVDLKSAEGSADNRAKKVQHL